MRVLFVTYPWLSHYYPMVPLAWAFRAAGHEVRIAGAPGLVDPILESGMHAVPVGTDFESAQVIQKNRLSESYTENDDRNVRITDHESLDPTGRALVRKLSAVAFTIAEAMVDDLVAFARSWKPELIVYDGVTYAGAVAAAVLGVPCASFHWGDPMIYRLENIDLGTEPSPEFERLFARYGVEPRDEPDWWLDTCPPSMCLDTQVSRTSLRFVPYNGTTSIPDWLDIEPGRPRVCVTWGLSTARTSGPESVRTVRDIVESLAGRDVEIVLAVAKTEAAQLADLEAQWPRIRVLTSFPLHVLLPGCTTVVHHSGGATALAAVTAGANQLAISARPLPMLLGDRIAATGIGRHLLHRDADAEAITRELDELFGDPAYHKATEHLGDEMRAQPSPAEVATRLAEAV